MESHVTLVIEDTLSGEHVFVVGNNNFDLQTAGKQFSAAKLLVNIMHEFVPNVFLNYFPVNQQAAQVHADTNVVSGYAPDVFKLHENCSAIRKVVILNAVYAYIRLIAGNERRIGNSQLRVHCLRLPEVHNRVNYDYDHDSKAEHRLNQNRSATGVSRNVIVDVKPQQKEAAEKEPDSDRDSGNFGPREKLSDAILLLAFLCFLAGILVLVHSLNKPTNRRKL